MKEISVILICLLMCLLMAGCATSNCVIATNGQKYCTTPPAVPNCSWNSTMTVLTCK